MAKHLVKCFYCSQQFDANSEPFIMVNSRRYAHKECADRAEKEKTKEQKDKEQLENYIKQLFGISCISPKIKKQIKTYREEKHFSYSAIYKTLKYFFDIKKNPIEKANGGIGIVPWKIDMARDYWLDVLQTQEINKELTTQLVEMPQIEIHIKVPQKDPIRRFRRSFSFLEEGGNE